ncbi:MAG TPA: hypothetical protein VHC49_20350 [Mycobacteriales bacterium]|nr:hypothetical protein [Mycobacteriales bacterium]
MWKPWTEIDWDAPRPAKRQLKASKSRIRFTPASVNSPAALSLIDTFRSLFVNGGAHIAAFTVDQVDDAAHWFFSRNRFDEYGFIDLLLTSDALVTAIPDLLPVRSDPMAAEFVSASPLTFDGSLAGSLVWGGPYRSFDGSHADAKRAGVAVSAELIGDRYEDFQIDQSHGAWSEWFCGIAWDRTWILTDCRNERVTPICITDTD